MPLSGTHPTTSDNRSSAMTWPPVRLVSFLRALALQVGQRLPCSAVVGVGTQRGLEGRYRLHCQSLPHLGNGRIEARLSQQVGLDDIRPQCDNNVKCLNSLVKTFKLKQRRPYTDMNTRVRRIQLSCTAIRLQRLPNTTCALQQGPKLRMHRGIIAKHLQRRAARGKGSVDATFLQVGP